MAGLKGTFGKQVVFRQRNGKTFVSAYPDMSNRLLSEKQVAVHKRMKAASEYAHSIMQEEEQRNQAQVRLDVPSTKLYTSLVREYFRLEKEKELAGNR